ncbi:MAG TPA: molybdenum cofactor guanylyltransferase [Cytophagales bacterium]|nr:molybdenum cofactor guanylyltransferase [Cytophagales bacterium]
MTKPTLYGLVLAGGQSTRMGRDKALLSYHGLPQRDHVFQLLSRFCKKVFTSVGHSKPNELVTNPIKDAFSIKGPLNGILSAFQQHEGVAWITMPIDMPLVNDQTIQLLIAHRDIEKVATCFYDSDGKNPEPLLTLWEPKAAHLLRAFYDEGKTSPREFLISADINLLRIPDVNLLKSINTPEEFDSLQGLRKK